MSPAERQQLATLRDGEPVDAVFACVRKERLIARTGTAYLALELRDRTGTLAARVFRDADLLAGGFERGELVHVRGRAVRFRDELMLELDSVRRATGADPADFLPVAYRDLDELDGFLEHLACEVAGRELRTLLDGLLADGELRALWRRAPSTRRGHHAYLGGLLEHTVAVATLAQELALQHPRCDSDLLICAAIVHDLGKTEEFAYGASIELSDAGRLLGHVQLGLRLLERRARGVLSETSWLALAHCVLCHHGPEVAPGRRFASVEALALYRLNALDASVKGALEHGLPR